MSTTPTIKQISEWLGIETIDIECSECHHDKDGGCDDCDGKIYADPRDETPTGAMVALQWFDALWRKGADPYFYHYGAMVKCVFRESDERYVHTFGCAQAILTLVSGKSVGKALYTAAVALYEAEHKKGSKA